MKKVTGNFYYRIFKNVFSIGLRVYYKNISVSGFKKFPVNNPVMTVSNHPTGLMDVFLAAFHIKRQIKFTAAGGLFKDKLQAAFLTNLGAIPLYRHKDTHDEMDKNVDSFENCFQELETGGAIGFYPEGTSHPEPWVNPIKTGAARIALQAEERNNFSLNLKIVPIGINSLKPGSFRDSALVKFGNPISLQKYQTSYKSNPVEAAEQLTAEIQKEMERCTFHITHDSILHLFNNFQIIGLDEIKPGNNTLNNKVEKFYSITKILDHKISQNEETLIINDINSLENRTAELKQKMQKFALIDHPFSGIKTILRFLYFFIISLLGFPFALVATIINIFPFFAAKNLGRKIAGKDISLIPAARLMSGVVIFLIYYLFLFIIVGINTGINNSLVTSSSLFVAGYLTLWYWEVLKSFSMVSKKIYYWLTNRKMMNEIIAMRVKILNDLNSLLEH
jgi:glycerol-3-phosphate O-acyltransferase / dihydroxyacetone phosphate acyltransferase